MLDGVKHAVVSDLYFDLFPTAVHQNVNYEA